MLSAPSQIAREVDQAFLFITVVSVALLAAITLVMVYFAFKYRRGVATTTSQLEGHKWLEITWIVVPCIIVTFMFFAGFKGFLMMRDVPENAMVVEVTGRQWSWDFFYPDDGIGATELVVPVNQPVKVLLTAPADDVLHSFYLPSFRVKEDVLPGSETFLWFESERIGVFNIFCAEFCGKDHAKMITKLRVVSRLDYDQWIQSQIAKRYKPVHYEGFIDPNHAVFGKDDLNLDVDTLYQTYCTSCHGANGDGSGLPDLARDFRTAEAWKKTQSVADIFRSLKVGIPDTQMRAFPNLTPWETIALAQKVRTFSSTPLESDTREVYDALVAEYELDKIQAPGPTLSIDDAMDKLLDEVQDGNNNN
jgi:cytochrome c oxidase subunit II